MEKILIALGTGRPDKETLAFGCYLARLTRSKLTGIFFDRQYEPMLSWEYYQERGRGTDHTIPLEQCMAIFRETCVLEEVNYVLHRDHGLPAEEIIEETRFADVLIIDAQSAFLNGEGISQLEGLKTLLRKSECPVIIAPETFEIMDEIVFAYNGTASAAFAIKQFTYLFPQLCQNKATIVQVNETGHWDDRDKSRFMEWLRAHYINLHFQGLSGAGDNVLFDYVLKKPGRILVMGAYGRTALSSFFRHSTADLLIKTVTQPIFIAHL